MTPLNTLLALLTELRQLDARLQGCFQDFIKRYFAFCGRRHLRLKCETWPGGRKKGARIWKISWGRHFRLPHGPREWHTWRLPEPFDPRWVFTIALDWARKDTYVAFDRERRQLNGISRQLAKTQRALRLSLVYKWGPRCTANDRERARAIVAGTPGLGPGDLGLVASAIAFDGHLTRLEVELDGITVAFKSIPSGLRPGFEPVLKRRRDRHRGELQSRHVRLLWGYPKGYRPGERRIDSIAVWPTDVLMRELGLPARTRRAVGAVVREFQPVHREYAGLIHWLGRYRAQVGQLRTRLDKLAPTAVPAPLRPFGLADRNQSNLGSTA